MDDFWKSLIQQYGRRLLYIDSGAILGAFERGNDRFNELLPTLIGYDFVTSTYVVAESVRRIVKSKASAKFLGPKGERRVALARYFLNTWLSDHAVRVICIPEKVFEQICVEYHSKNKVQCDLTDLISYSIVTGLQQREIVSDDGHFRDFGLTCLPGEIET